MIILSPKGGAHQNRARHFVVGAASVHRAAVVRVSKPPETVHGHGLRAGNNVHIILGRSLVTAAVLCPFRFLCLLQL